MSNERRTAEREYYLNQLSVTAGERLTLGRTFFLSELSKTSGNKMDLEKEWLVAQGAVGNNREDLWQNYLESEGYTGAVETMRRDYYRDNS